MAQVKRGQVQDHRTDELVQLGVPRDQAQAWLDAQAPEGEDLIPSPNQEPLTVWPQNRPVVRLFMQLQTQWRRRPLGDALEGLRHEAVRAAIELQRLKHPRRLYRQLVDMEHAAVEAWNGT